MASPHTAEVRSLWGLDYTRLIVNHGSYGATPLEVLARQDAWRRRMEAAPTRFMATELKPALRAAAEAVATAVRARAQDLVLLDNATAGCNAVIASTPFAPGDEILLTDHSYGAVVKAARHIASRTGAALTTARLPFPNPSRDGLIAAIAASLSPRTRLVIIDHITSPSALLLPIAEIVAACRNAGVPVLVDGAHGPGQVPLDLGALGADYYVGNGHKWWMGAKGAGFLWAAPNRQADLHPTIISHGYGAGFLEEFDWTGTRDWSAALVLPDAIALHQRLGGPDLMVANRALARAAAQRLADRFGLPLPSAPEFEAAMAMVELPLMGGPDADRLAGVTRALFHERGCDVPVMAIGGKLWLRLSAQAYNLPEDYDRLADLVDVICHRTT